MRVMRYFIFIAYAAAFVQKPYLLKHNSRIYQNPGEIYTVEQLDRLKDALRDILKNLGKSLEPRKQQYPELIPIPVLTPEEEYIQRKKNEKREYDY
tara:strand:+ start:223 stop:510 length:288 start_codon:yes stop_codon:yes gene_type:complete